MAVEAREPQTPTKTERDLSNCQVVTEVTPDMIILDLAKGLDRQAIADKYAYTDEAGDVQPFELWMVNRMFEDPSLKGRRPSKVRALPFAFKSTNADAPIADVNTVKAEIAGTTAQTTATVTEENSPVQDLFTPVSEGTEVTTDTSAAVIDLGS